MTGWRGWDTSETNLKAEGARSFSLSVALPWRTPARLPSLQWPAMNKLIPGLIFFLLLLLTACGGGGSSSTNPPPPPPVTVNANVAVDGTTNGPFVLAMSTSFQPAEWDYQFFQNVPSAITPLGNLNPHHIRLQGVSQGIPQTSPTTWDFSKLDAITQPVLAVGDQSPEFQVAWAPTFMWSNGTAGGRWT